MLRNLRLSPSLAPTFKSAAARPTDRIPSAVLAVAVLGSLLLSALTVDRLARVERHYQPALEATRQLGASLEATRVLLTTPRLGALDARIARADSQAQRFHRVATVAARGAQPQAQMQAYDDAFGDYYVAARRAAAGLSMSGEPDGASAEDAALGYRLLRENLAVGLDAQTQAIEAARPATAPVELAGWLTLALIAGALLLRRAAPTAAAEWPVAAQVTARDARAAWIDAGPATVVPLHQAVERLARQRMAASVAAAKVAKRNNELQIETARGWITPPLSIVRDQPPRIEMDVYEDDRPADEPRFRGLALVTA
jgi:hypothetical protein